MDNIIIVNQNQLNQKIQQMISDGKDNIYIVSDFDKTLTKAFVDGKYRASLLAVLRDDKILGPDYSEKAQVLFDYYHHIEVDPNISFEQKKELMLERREKHFKLLLNSGLNKNDIQKAVQSTNVQFRDYTIDLIDLTNNNSIPFIIMSASGLGYDGIFRYLENINKLYPNICILSNSFKWDCQGNAINIHYPIVHSFNKDESIIHISKLYPQIKDRKNIILLGDSAGDANMASEGDDKIIIRIGFLNDNIDNNLELFKKHFDILVTNDGSMEYVYNLINSIIN